ncbi:MAG: hypothetical protein HC860_11085 [Alkalinema sp. RU_4_3]|nr:hypothetical protein [Alkalinema sp. RU_4_3]
MRPTFTITLLGLISCRLLRGTNGLLRLAVAVCGPVVDALMRRPQGLCPQYPSLQPVYLVAESHGSESERRHSLRHASIASLFTGMLVSDRQDEGKSSNILGWSNLKLDIDNWSGRTRETIPSLT